MAKKKKNNNVEKEEHLVINGTVVEALPGTKFKVQLENLQDKFVICSLSGKLRLNKITIVPGDSVEVKLSPYDLNQGIISWRFT